MLRWLRRRRAPETLPGAPAQLTEEQRRAWREFVAQCNTMLDAGVPGMHRYSQRIREAVIQKRMTVEQFIAANPVPWNRTRPGPRGH